MACFLSAKSKASMPTPKESTNVKVVKKSEQVLKRKKEEGMDVAPFSKKSKWVVKNASTGTKKVVKEGKALKVVAKKPKLERETTTTTAAAAPKATKAKLEKLVEPKVIAAERGELSAASDVWEDEPLEPIEPTLFDEEVTEPVEEEDSDAMSEDRGEPVEPEVKVEPKAPEAPETPVYSMEYYANGYCLRNKLTDQYYARDESNNEYYCSNDDKALVYAYRKVTIDGVVYRWEYPAKKDGVPVYIVDSEGRPKYPVDVDTQRIIFPLDPETGEEMYLSDNNGQIFYPENKFGDQFYRKDLEGNDVPINSTYAQLGNGTQVYPFNSKNDQFYLTEDNMEIPAVRRRENKLVAYYATKANGDEIYPRMFFEEEDLVEQ